MVTASNTHRLILILILHTNGKKNANCVNYANICGSLEFPLWFAAFALHFIYVCCVIYSVEWRLNDRRHKMYTQISFTFCVKPLIFLWIFTESFSFRFSILNIFEWKYKTKTKILPKLDGIFHHHWNDDAKKMWHENANIKRFFHLSKLTKRLEEWWSF